MMKPDSLYNAGMKPLMYSIKQAKNKCTFFIKKLDGIETDMTFVIIKTTWSEKIMAIITHLL